MSSKDCEHCFGTGIDHGGCEHDIEIAKLRAALERIRDCDFVITLPDRMDAVRAIAREALTTTEESSVDGATDKDSLTVGSIS